MPPSLTAAHTPTAHTPTAHTPTAHTPAAHTPTAHTPTAQAPAALARAALVALMLCGATAGCATSYSVSVLPSGITIHTFRRGYANAHVVSRGSNFYLVDSGLEANAPALAETLREHGFEPAKLRAVVITHGHADHAGGAAYFRKTFGTRVVAGREDRALLATGRNDTLCPTSDRARDRLAEDQGATYSPFQADVWVAQELDLAALTGIPGRVVAVPGHTKGSVLVVVDGAVLVGDLFRGAIVGSSAELHFYMCDLAANRADVRAMLDRLAPRAALFFTGHFGPVTRSAVAERFASP